MTTTEDQIPNTEKTEPIPPSSPANQYRAIGLLWGKYVPGAQINQGTLLTSDGTNVDAVVLGRLLGLLKSRIDLEKEHLWVVYPRTKNKGEKTPPEESNDPLADDQPRPESPKQPQELSNELKENFETSSESPASTPEESFELAADHPRLHVQMAGICEPETLHPDSPAPVLEQKPDYFSVQGEVVYQQKEQGWVMVKILQSPRQNTDGKPQYFKLKLSGFLPEKAVKNFWHLHVKRLGNNLYHFNIRLHKIGEAVRNPSPYGTSVQT